ncbi:hypothetical protein BGZ70_010612 [Mortierella alpina]|uniref:START domain-containing protein n=1 Tax=Mortierella alpina TaxID=64518 RepID=A0A9P6M5G9_MORAP|nr:hypothetical protein BGZ70_010612 [Mortierella alpina]
MKGSRRSEMIISDDLEWVEQHHRNTTRKSMHSAGHNQLPASYDFAPSGDESDAPEKNRQSMYYHSDPQKLTKEYHIDQAIQAIQLLKAASKPAGWKKVLKHKSGCLVYQSTGQQDKHPAFKGEHVIRGYRAQDVFSVVGVRKLWDDWYDELSCVESYDDATNLMYMVMKGTMSSKTRDISMVERIEVERDGTIYFASCSVESNKIPRISGKVRADIFVAGWIIQPLPSNPPITKITYVIQTDLLSRLPKFIARRALAKRPLVITTIETHLKKNGVPMVMSTLVSQTANRHRSLSEPLKPEKFLFSPQESEENIQSGSAFLSPLKPTSSDKEEQLNDKEESGEEDLQLTMASVNGNSTGGIYESTAKQQDQRSTTSNEETRARSPQLTQAPDPMQGRIRQSLPLQTRRTLPSGVDFQHRHSTYRTNSQTSLHSRSIPRNTTPSTPERAQMPHVITPATPPLTPTTSTDGKEAASDSDASLTPKVRVVPRAPKAYTSVDTSLPARPSSMAFHAFGMRSPSAIMEERRHSAMITRSASFAPRHSHVSHVMPMRGNSSVSLQSLSHRSSMPVNPLSNSMNKRHSIAPSVDSSRSSTLLAPMLVLPHRHSETARKALAMFKVLASSPEDRWRAVSSDGVFKSYSRVISGAGLPMLRGEGVITGGWTVEQINAVIESSGCREIWDERFENLSIAETFNSNEYLFHVTLRGIGSLTGRDLAGVTIIDRDPQTSALYNVSTSVLDSTIPEDPGRIRALLELSGWSLRPTFDGQGNTIAVNVTFVIQVDIRGTLPNSVVKSMTASMMTATGSYELCFKAAPGWTEIRIGRKVYKDGYDFFIKPDDPTVRVELAPDFGGVRVFTTLDHEGQSIVAQVTRKGQTLTGAAAIQQQPQQVHEEEEEDEHSSGRRMRHSAVPRRPRDSRVFDSSTPSYGGPSLRKSSSHLKSNDLIHSSAQVDEGFSAATGSGSDLRPHGAPPPSISPLSDGAALMGNNVPQGMLQRQPEDMELELELVEEQDPHAAKDMEIEQETSDSLAFMTSPDSSPLPAPTQTPTTPESDSSHKSSLSLSPLAGGVRRVTFSPDVVDNSENRCPVGRVRRRKTKKNLNCTARQDVLNHDAGSESKDDSDLVTVSVLEVLPAKGSQGDQDLDSDEAEFAEALSEFPGSVAEIQYDDKHRVGVHGSELMTMDHLLEQEPLWQTAVELFLEELSSTQIKVAVILALLVVYVSGILSPVL